MSYTANLSRTQNRAGWSVSFRHPALINPKTGKPGKKVRYGLSTRDQDKATDRVEELNIMLADERWWSATARDSAEARFHPRVVEIFYTSLEPKSDDPRSIRDDLLPLPTRDEGFRSALLLGTTGAGKTSLLRHLIGTDPDEERFPTTATGRTTIADTEIATSEGPYKAAVTFFSVDEVREHLEDCLLQAVLAVHRDESPSDIEEAMLQHQEQRFRFNYILGNGASTKIDSNKADDSLGDLLADLPKDDVAPGGQMPELGSLDLDKTRKILSNIMDSVRTLAHTHAQKVATAIEAESEEETRVVEELIEETIDEELRSSDSVQQSVDKLENEIRRRFELIDVGSIRRTRQGWPSSWTWESADRTSFIRQLRRFTSNSKAGFGRLLTPIVNGLRVMGPFTPEWSGDNNPQFIFFDTQGLGHTPDSSSSIPTQFTELIDEVDAVLLVDNAEQPMQAAPAAAMRALAQTGHAGKLFFCFTHFDGVSGDNLPSDRDKARHVLSASDAHLTAIGEAIGPFAERPLRARRNAASYFFGNLHKRLNAEKDKTTIRQLTKLLEGIESSGDRPTLAETRPTYELANLIVGIRDAVEEFQQYWRAVLGLGSRKGVQKEHWARIKALSRRFAERMGDEYLHLRPIADLQSQLQKEIFLLIQNPIEWTSGEPSDDEKQALYEEVANRVSRELMRLARRRLRDERFTDWQDAWWKRGRGSTKVRAKIMADRIYEPAAPIPKAAPDPHSNQFLHEIVDIVRTVAGELKLNLR